MAGLPLVGMPTDRKLIGVHPFLAAGEKYVRAVVDGAGCIPLLIPNLVPSLPLRQVLERMDGLLLTGSPSNIEPHHYGNEPSYEGNLHDPARDATNLALIPLAVEMGVPVLAVCRGLQEVNVAFGGTLHQVVHEQSGFQDHREGTSELLELQYGPSHAVTLSGGGILAGIAGGNSAMVNSLHGQGINRLGGGLIVEAVAEDGLIEAFRHDGPGFLLAMQWHPEWRVTENPFYLGSFQAFGAACRQRAMNRAR